LVYEQLLKRGGLHPHDDDYLLDLKWQRAHTRANRGETTLQTLWRRGNDMADVTANDGRLLHIDDARCDNGHALTKSTTRGDPRKCDGCGRDDIGGEEQLYQCSPCRYDLCTDCARANSKKHMNVKVWRIKTLMKRGSEWASWVGRTALAQRDGIHEPDHTLPQQNRREPKRTNMREPVVPTQAKVIRRCPWAVRSLGTVEFTGDLHDEDEAYHSLPTSQAVEVLNKWRPTPINHSPAETRVRRYMMAFKCHGGPTTMGKRLLPRSFGSEDLEELLPSDALGHHMMVAGLPPRQYF